jgi:L-rhamnose mutarotase
MITKLHRITFCILLSALSCLTQATVIRPFFNGDRSQAIEIVFTATTRPDIKRMKAFCKRHRIPLSWVYQWQNRAVIFGAIPDVRNNKQRLQQLFPKATVKLYENPFYVFNIRSNCNDKIAQASEWEGEWEHIILTANLVSDTIKQREYLQYHATQFNHWPEVSKGFCNAGFQQLLIFKNDRQLILVISIPKGADFQKMNSRTTENNPRVNDWNKMMAQYQEGVSGTKPGETWVFFEHLSL